MATNKIEVSVDAKKQVSRPTTGMGVKSAADISKQALTVGKQSVKVQTLLLQETKKLVKSLTSVDKSIKDLKTSIEKNTTASQAGAGPSTGGGGGSGGIGNIGSSIPFAGAIIGAFGYLDKKVTELARASRQALMEQKGTFGIAETIKSNVGILDPTEVAQYTKTRRMQSGRLQSEAGLKEDSRAYRYAERFGDVQSVAQIQGLMDRMSQGAGGLGGTQGLEDVLRITAKEGGIQTELPLMMRMMEDVMETAVSNGVKDAKLSESFAKEVASYAAADPSRSLKSIQKSIEQRRSISDAVSKGTFGQNALTARTTALSMQMIGADAGLRKKIGGQLGISQERLESGELSHSERMAMVSLLNEGAGGVDVGKEMKRKIAMESGSASRYIAMMQQVYQSGATASQLTDDFNMITGKNQATPKPEDMLATETTGEIKNQAVLAAEKKSMLISHKGAELSRDYLYKKETEFLKLAEETSPLLSKGLEGVNIVLKESASGIEVLTNKLIKLNESLQKGDKGLLDIMKQYVTD